MVLRRNPRDRVGGVPAAAPPGVVSPLPFPPTLAAALRAARFELRGATIFWDGFTACECGATEGMIATLDGMAMVTTHTKEAAQANTRGDHVWGQAGACLCASSLQRCALEESASSPQATQVHACCTRDKSRSPQLTAPYPRHRTQRDESRQL